MTEYVVKKNFVFHSDADNYYDDNISCVQTCTRRSDRNENRADIWSSEVRCEEFNDTAGEGIL